MKTVIQLYTDIVAKVTVFYEHLELHKLEKRTGRPLALSIIETIALSLFKQTSTIATKKAVWNIFRPRCSYKTMVVNMNKHAPLALCIFRVLLWINQKSAHLIKHTDETDVPVCLNKNAKNHKTMHGLAEWGYSGKGWFYGLKLGLTTDLPQTIQNVVLASGNADDRALFRKLNEKLKGIFVADAGHISEKLEKEFFIEHERIALIKPRKNMKKMVTPIQKLLYDTRTMIETNFRKLKMFFGLITSLPRSVNGYFGNYIYSLLAYVCA
jgi:Transposase DDE domain